ncbi:MAG: dihydrodipicolinate synthase family protein [Candidatus Thorarchaeota archaeon]|nr:MAG: dihydrodipicolinate synthase family protein [Candidatus Thorarchaeota archaeon]
MPASESLALWEDIGMTSTRISASLKGVSVTTTTPFAQNLSEIDIPALTANLEYLVREGIEMVVPCGNTGEFYSLSEAEWNQVVEATVDAVSGKAAVMAGIGHSTTTAKNMMQQAESLGADGVMVMYPQHVFSSEEGLLNYVREILDAAGTLGVVLYKKGPLLSDTILDSLIGHESLVGVKYAFGRIVDFVRTVQNLGPSIVWSCGTAERFAPFFWLAGASGFTSGLANFAPKVSLSMFDALEQGNYTKAMELQALVSELEFQREGRGTASNVPVIKALMDYIGLKGGDCRPPIHPLSRVEKELAIQAVTDWGLVRL